MSAYTSEECILYPFDVSREEARVEIEKHGVPFAEFVDEMGDRPIYSSGDVLAWLGY